MADHGSWVSFDVVWPSEVAEVKGKDETKFTVLIDKTTGTYDAFLGGEHVFSGSTKELKEFARKLLQVLE